MSKDSSFIYELISGRHYHSRVLMLTIHLNLHLALDPTWCFLSSLQEAKFEINFLEIHVESHETVQNPLLKYGHLPLIPSSFGNFLTDLEKKVPEPM